MSISQTLDNRVAYLKSQTQPLRKLTGQEIELVRALGGGKKAGKPNTPAAVARSARRHLVESARIAQTLPALARGGNAEVIAAWNRSYDHLWDGAEDVTRLFRMAKNLKSKGKDDSKVRAAAIRLRSTLRSPTFTMIHNLHDKILGQPLNLSLKPDGKFSTLSGKTTFTHSGGQVIVSRGGKELGRVLPGAPMQRFADVDSYRVADSLVTETRPITVQVGADGIARIRIGKSKAKVERNHF
jgi:hypothetical protein